MVYPPLESKLWLVPALLFGACVGSFLNVVIHRLPRGLSVNRPRRSFCPHCQRPIPARLNLPLVSWLWLRGRCRECGARIPFRYFLVEALTAALFVVVWWHFAPLAPLPAVLALAAFLALAVAISWIDAEHMVIPGGLTWTGTVIGLLGCAAWPRLPALAASDAGAWWQGLLHGGIGWLAGFLGLGLVVELGKLALGRKKLAFDQPTPWVVKESTRDDEPMRFEIGAETLSWWDLFFRKTDRMVVEATDIRVDGVAAGSGKLVIRETDILLPDGRVVAFADLRSLDGVATRVVAPREAMGRGDMHLLAMIGAFFGWTGVVFSLVAASFLGIAGALASRIGFGRHLPFGPYLVVGAVVWMFGGWRLFAWYAEFLAPLFETYP